MNTKGQFLTFQQTLKVFLFLTDINREGERGRGTRIKTEFLPHLKSHGFLLLPTLALFQPISFIQAQLVQFLVLIDAVFLVIRAMQ